MKIGILGAGEIAHEMAKTVAGMADCEVLAVGARELPRAGGFAKEHGIPRAYGSYGELVADREVELIYIATPHSHHYQHAKLALEEGKHVLCEKAFTANEAQARELFALAEARGLFLGEAMWTRFLPMKAKLQQLLRDGAIGQVRSLSASIGYAISDIPRLREPALAGGALLDIGVYVLNFAAIVLGEEIEKVASSCELYETGVDACESVTLTFSGGRMAVLHANMTALSDRGGVICGSEGYIRVGDVETCAPLEVYDGERRLVARHEAPPCHSGYQYEVAAAAKAVREGRGECPEMPHAETLRILELCDRLRDAWGVRYPFE